MNSSHNEQHVLSSINKIRVVFEKASSVIEALKPGEKITATGLAEQLAAEIGMKGPSLYPTLKFLYEGYPGVKISRGAHGGIEKLPPQTDLKSEDTNVLPPSEEE